ncbi:FHIPEP family type III secretion protein [Anaerosporobacter faecicola]|uniref:FHIPEP family type III secretion protein n=1 Tax=Anaerosporobacter faecicola TaxID=2718714 RepID=UPI00143A039A|nr:FHIPEP family type III secretion protein [Anaerosporobacter faecicola]
MNIQQFGSNLVQYRQAVKMTQEDLAMRLGVTSQAVSKWERGIGYPDIESICSIAEILHLTLDQLFNSSEKITESGNSQDIHRVMSEILADPIMFQAGESFLPMMMKENAEHFKGIQIIREEIAKKYGYLMPVVRMKDNCELAKNQYQICIYDEVVINKTITDMETFSFEEIYAQIKEVVTSQYERILNRQLVKNLLDNVEEHYPVMVKGFIPEKISYGTMQKILTGIIQEKKPIRNLIKILEWIEDDLNNKIAVEEIGKRIAAKL